MPVDGEGASGDPIAAGRAALAHGAWEQARSFFEAAVSQAETATALEGLSWAAWWCNDPKVVFDARERAYRRYRAQGDRLGAARMATWLGTDHVDFYGELAVGQGWLGRARRLLDGLEPGPEHGWLFVHEAEKHLFAHDTAHARDLGARATELGRRLGLVDLEMMGLAAEGLALVMEGEITEGMSRLDEATAAALGEDFPEILPIGWCWCYMIHACELVRDYDRAAQWCRRLEEWSARTRTLFNSMIDKRPAVIAQCATAQDVAAALRLGREQGLEIAVRGGGHSVAGMSVCEAGLVIDTRPMNQVEVDPQRRTARVGAGCTWSQLDRATQEHGLATTGGRVSSTGVTGLTLGGGSGWLERQHGLACDNLISVELVTADGSIITASENENPELFWALHGGGGNFGVATSLTFGLHPVGPEVLAGLLLYPAERGLDLMHLMRDVMPDAPTEFGPLIAYITVPPEDDLPTHLHGKLASAIILCYTGPVTDGEQLIKPFRDLGPEVDLVAPTPYADFQCSIDDPPGYRNWWTAEYLHVVTDEVIDTIHAHALATPIPTPSQTLIIPWGGAVAAVGEDETPLTQRDASWVVHPFALWADPADDDAVIGWARTFRDDVRGYSSGGVYLNFIGDEGADRVQAAFGEQKYARLAAVKAHYDPGNIFRSNHNIKPAG